jgi:integrase
LLFATRNGTPWDQNMVLKRKFKPLLEALGIKLPRGDGFYILRHGNATLMSSFGAPQKLRQERLGHADGSPVTESVYTHVISEDGKRIAAQLGKAVWGVLDASWTEKENGPGVAPPKPFHIN